MKYLFLVLFLWADCTYGFLSEEVYRITIGRSQ
jgi:hypothetical protein